jgi:hypothetical protein
MKVNFIPAAVVLALATPGGQAWADEDDDEHDEHDDDEHGGVAELEMHGYGDLQFAYHRFGPDQNRDGGSQRDHRVTFDTTRFTLELEGELPAGVEFAAEIEFEHGGTGTTQEIEYDEFGEFETEVEKGGEVVLEELKVSKRLTDDLTLTVGRFYVAVGLLARHHEPIDYLGVVRSEAETTMIPAVWDEMGVGLSARLPFGRATVQVVNGLDSTGFSSGRWVASGQQTRYELVRATDLAGVARLDVDVVEGVEAGASIYVGGTTRNRPKPDLVPDCTASDREVAPCGYIDAPVVIGDLHALAEVGRFRGSLLAMWGHLDDAAAISNRNDRLSNEADVARTPVGDEAIALSAEGGVDVADLVGLPYRHQLEPFARLEHVDTMVRVREGLFDNPRYERTIASVGVSYVLADAFFTKLDVAHRRFGTDELRPETSVRSSIGFVY